MKIEDNKTIKELQQEFNSKFPYLKIEFYSRAHKDHKGSPNEFLIKPDNQLRDIRSIHTETDMEILGTITASELEQEFIKTFGLNIQVFRKSRGLWLQTIATDNWSLEDLNTRGKEAAEGYKI